MLALEDIEIEKKNYCNTAPAPWKDVDIEKVLVSNKTSFGGKSFKYFRKAIKSSKPLYNDNKVKPLQIMLSKTSAYVKSYDGRTK